MPRQTHVHITMPDQLWKELQDHVEEQKRENPVASASDVIRRLVQAYLKKAKSKTKKSSTRD